MNGWMPESVCLCGGSRTIKTIMVKHTTNVDSITKNSRAKVARCKGHARTQYRRKGIRPPPPPLLLFRDMFTGVSTLPSNCGRTNGQFECKRKKEHTFRTKVERSVLLLTLLPLDLDRQRPTFSSHRTLKQTTKSSSKNELR